MDKTEGEKMEAMEGVRFCSRARMSKGVLLLLVWALFLSDSFLSRFSKNAYFSTSLLSTT